MKPSYSRQWLEEIFGILKDKGKIGADKMFLARNAIYRPFWCAGRIIESGDDMRFSPFSLVLALFFLCLRFQWGVACILDTYFYSFFELFPESFLDMPDMRAVDILERAFNILDIQAQESEDDKTLYEEYGGL